MPFCSRRPEWPPGLGVNVLLHAARVTMGCGMEMSSSEGSDPEGPFLTAALTASVPEVLLLCRQGPVTPWGPRFPLLQEEWACPTRRGKAPMGPHAGPHGACAVSPSSKVSQKQILSQTLREEAGRSGGPDRPRPQMSVTFLVLLFGDHGHCHGAGKLGLPAVGQAGNLH